MLTEDYLIRMINLAIAALLQLIGLRKAGSYPEAQALIDLTLEQLLGLRASMAKNLDDDRLYFLLTRNDRLDTRRLLIVADLFHQEGDLNTAQNRLVEAREDYTRALKYTLEVIFQESQPGAGEQLPKELLDLTGALHEKVNILVSSLDLRQVGVDTLWPLANYYEEFGAFQLAEKVLLLMAERPQVQSEMRAEIADFYRRVLQRPAAEIQSSGLSQDYVRQQLSRWETT